MRKKEIMDNVEETNAKYAEKTQNTTTIFATNATENIFKASLIIIIIYIISYVITQW